ncbi:phosphatase 2C-like domain-containing protein [Flagelloscypha sp. PMI_526]|nr:phosphatase 2C-like domain-containing protein [Flagelloscypha sp. PMI_526]
MPPREDLNARSATITSADLDTHGILNRKAEHNPSFQIGVVADKGHRRSMEDSHSFVFDFASVRGQGFFAIFDGHAGKHAAEWCGGHFHEFLLQSLRDSPHLSIPETLNLTFGRVDENLSQQAADPSSASSPASEAHDDAPMNDTTGDDSPQKSSNGSKIKQALRSLTSSSPAQPSAAQPSPQSNTTAQESSPPPVIVPPEKHRRVLYVANAGDAARHAGGFVLSGRVNGVLAVTRSLGDSSMKEFVVGAPYTTETDICEDDEFLILACDGLWDICSDQKAVDHVKDILDPQKQAEALVQLALEEHSQDNISVLVIRFKHNT